MHQDGRIADKLYARRSGNAVAAINDSPINAVSGGCRRESSPHNRRHRSPSRQGRSRWKTPGPYKDDSNICFYHTSYGEQARKCKPGCQWVPGNGSRELNALSGGMIFLQDDDSKQQFTVDTGAVCSVHPHRSNAQPGGPQLSGADGRSIPTWGTICPRLSFGLRTFFVTFFLAAVYRPILGLDFLSAYGLLVEPVGCQVLDSKTLKPLSKTPTAAGTLRSKFAATHCSITPSVRSLLASFPAIVGDGKGKPSPKHKIHHTIETTGRPVFAKARRLDPDKLRKAEAEFRELEAAGIIRRSDSPWSSPLHMVRKKDGSWRPCGDYRWLNLATTHNRYPLPSILDLSNKLHGCKFFSCIDLMNGYH